VTASACTFVVSAFNRPTHLELCLLSLCLQTRTDWTAIVTDNADSSVYSEMNEDAVRRVGDGRIAYRYTGSTCPSCYHSAEAGAARATGTYLSFPSDDSYFVPEFLERMLESADGADLIYCDVLYDRRLTGRRAALQCEPRVCAIDKTSFLVRRDKFIGFPDKRNDGMACPADGQAIERMIQLGYGHRHVDECLVVHN